MSEQSFSGFPAEALRFLADLANNNNREWFNAHKQDYLDYLVAPAVAFVQEMGQRLQYISPHIQYDTRLLVYRIQSTLQKFFDQIWNTKTFKVFGG